MTITKWRENIQAKCKIFKMKNIFCIIRVSIYNNRLMIKIEIDCDKDEDEQLNIFITEINYIS